MADVNSRCMKMGYVVSTLCVKGFNSLLSSSDEHQSARKHRDAELGPSAPLRQDLPGSSCAASVPGIPEPPEARPSHLDLQPQRHPHGPRWQGAPLHGLNCTCLSDWGSNLQCHIGQTRISLKVFAPGGESETLYSLGFWGQHLMSSLMIQCRSKWFPLDNSESMEPQLGWKNKTPCWSPGLDQVNCDDEETLKIFKNRNRRLVYIMICSDLLVSSSTFLSFLCICSF